LTAEDEFVYCPEGPEPMPYMLLALAKASMVTKVEASSLSQRTT
jgi:hypothetical protein